MCRRGSAGVRSENPGAEVLVQMPVRYWGLTPQRGDNQVRKVSGAVASCAWGQPLFVAGSYSLHPAAIPT